MVLDFGDGYFLRRARTSDDAALKLVCLQDRRFRQGRDGAGG